MPNVFLDTDVAFDILSKREPHHDSAIFLLKWAATGSIKLSISESSLATLFYLSFDIYKIKNAASKLVDFISICDVSNAGKDSVLLALHSEFKDKEDALQYYAALRSGADYFITRNKRDYKHAIATLPVFTPTEFIDIVL